MGVKNFRRTNGKSNRMYCVRVQIQFIGQDEPKTVYLRFRTHDMMRGYSPWTEDPKEAKFWLYELHAAAWVAQNPYFKGEVVCLHRDDAVLEAQRGMR